MQWQRIVAAAPPDHFSDENLGLLSVLCTHIASARLMEAELRVFPRTAVRSAEGRRDYRELLTLAASAAMSVVSLSTKLRLTPQAKVGKRAAFTATRPTAQPWEQ